MAYNYGLLSVNYGLLWSVEAYLFGLLGVPSLGIFAFRVGARVRRGIGVFQTFWLPRPFGINSTPASAVSK